MINLLRGPNRLRTLVGGSNRPRPSFMATLVLGTVSTNGQAGTYTNATVKTYPDWENVLRYAISGQSCHPGCRVVKNLVSMVASAKSADMTSAGWGTTGAATINSATTATLSNAAGGAVLIGTVDATSMGGKTYTIRAKLSVATGTQTARLQVQQDGVINNSSPDFTVTTTPQVFSFTTSFGAGGGGAGRWGVQNGSAGAIYQITATEFQLEDVTGQSNQNPGEYVSVGVLSAPFHGMNVDGVKGFATQNGNTVASNVVTEATGAAISASTLLGYRSEEARTNLCLQSQTFGTTWTVAAMSVSSDATTAPDGATTADNFVEDTTTPAGGHNIRQAITIANATTYTASLHIKPQGRTWVALQLATGFSGAPFAYFNLAGAGSVGTTGGSPAATIKQLSNGWYRISITALSTAVSGDLIILGASADGTVVYLGSGTAAYSLWGAQLEAGSFATSSIPTTTVAVTRNLDLDVYATSGNVNTNNVTISGTWTPNAAVASMGTTYIWGSYVDANNYTRIFHDGTNIIARKRIAGVNTDATKALAYAAGTSYIIAARFSASSGIDIFVNGVIGTNNSNTAALQLGATFQLLADGNGVVAGSSELKNDRVYPVALSDAQVAQIPA